MVRKAVRGRHFQFMVMKPELAMLDPVSFRRRPRALRHRDVEAYLSGQLRELRLPGPDRVSVGTACVCGDQQLGGVTKACRMLSTKTGLCLVANSAVSAVAPTLT